MKEKSIDKHDYKLMNRLWKGQIKPRLWDKCFPPKVIVPCIAVGTGIAFLIGVLPGKSLAIATIASYGTSYATASLALCLTVLVLILALPGQNRVQAWANRNRREGKSNSYTELVFSVLWAALTQLGFLIVCFLNIIFGGDIPLAPDGMWLSHRLALIGAMTFAAYAVAELHSVLATVSQLAVVMVKEARKVISDEADSTSGKEAE